jgi:hypothetical protein
MKKTVALLALVASVLLVAAPPASASGRGRGGGHPGHHFRGQPVRHARVFFGTSVFIGPAFYPYYYPPPYYYYPPAVYAPVYTAPVVVEPPTYLQQSPPPAQAAPAQSYWYYCEISRAYYPYVQQCPGGWLTVTPPAGGTTR